MKKEDVLDRFMDALGPRMVDCVGIGTAGSGHAVKRQEVNDEKAAKGEKSLYGVIWADEEQMELAKKNNFVWFIDFMIVHEGKLEDRPPEIQKLPAQISIYSHDPRLLFHELVGMIFSHLDYEKRFKTEQKWFNPGTYAKGK